MLRDRDSWCYSWIGRVDRPGMPPCSLSLTHAHTNRSVRGQTYLHFSLPAEEMALHFQKELMRVGMHVKCALQPYAINMTVHGIFTTFPLAEMLPEAPLIVLFFQKCCSISGVNKQSMHQAQYLWL